MDKEETYIKNWLPANNTARLFANYSALIRHGLSPFEGCSGILHGEHEDGGDPCTLVRVGSQSKGDQPIMRRGSCRAHFR